jgi:hypothetical protein
MKPITILRGRAGRLALRPSNELETIGARETGSGAAAAHVPLPGVPPPGVPPPAGGAAREAADVLGSTVAAPPTAAAVEPAAPGAVPTVPPTAPVTGEVADWTVCVTCETGPLVGAGAGAVPVDGAGAGALGSGAEGTLGAGDGAVGALTVVETVVVGTGTGVGAGSDGAGAGAGTVGVGAGSVGVDNVGVVNVGVDSVGVVNVGAGGRSRAVAGAVIPAANPMAATTPSEARRQFIPTL